MKKKLIASVLALATCFAFGGALAGCSEGKDGAAGAAGKSAYQIWLDAGNTGSEADFLASLKGEGSAACDHENILKAELAMYKHTATLNADGEWEYTNGKVLNVCADCGWSAITEEVMHDIQSNVVAPTCVAEGYTQVECTVCAYHEDKTDITEKTGHDLDTSNPENGVAVVNGYNSCVSENGYVAFQCSNCDYVEVLNDYDRYHYVTDWKLSADGLHVEGTCSRFCKETVSLAVPAFVAENYAYTAPSCVDEEPKEIFEIYVNSKVNPADAKYPNFSTEAADGYTKVLVKEKEVSINDVVHFYDGNAMDKTEYVMNGEESYKDIITELAGSESTCAKGGDGFFMCEVCNKPVPVKTYQTHNVESWKKISEDINKPDCQAMYEGICTVCTTRIEEDRVDCQYTYVIKTATSADKVCTICGDVESTLNFKETVENVPSTCVEKGSLTVILDDGKDTEVTLELGLAGHRAMINGEKQYMTLPHYDMVEYKDIITELTGKEAYCGNDTTNVGYGTGSGFYMCADCNKPIPVTTSIKHVAKDGKPAEDATCTKPGSVDCKVCEQDIVIPALDPEFNYTLTTTDYVTFTLTADCKNCDQTSGDHYVETTHTINVDVFKTEIEGAACGAYGYAYILKDTDGKEVARCHNDEDKVDHVYNGITMNKTSYDVTEYAFIIELAGKEASCAGTGTNGSGFFTCSTCNKPIPVTTTRTHDIKYNGTVTEASCTVNGKVEGTCEFCKEPGEKVIEAEGHDLMVASVNVAAGTITLGCKICNADADTTNDFSYVLYLSAGTKTVEEFISKPTCSAEGKTHYEYLFEDLKITLDIEGTDKTFEYGDKTFKFDDTADKLVHPDEAPEGKEVSWKTTYTKEITVDGKDYIATMVVTHYGYFCDDCKMLIETENNGLGVEDESLRVEKVVA